MLLRQAAKPLPHGFWRLPLWRRHLRGRRLADAAAAGPFTHLTVASHIQAC
jgi:hypothetical protein